VALIVAFLVVGIVLAIGVVIVLREAARLAQEPPPPLFDADEAYEWVVQELPDDVAATLTPDDVRRILDFQIEFFRQRGVSGNGSTAHPPGEVVISGNETVAYILERAAATGEAYLPEQVFAVVETQMHYLRAIGALSETEPGERPDT
jgi:hypothetical protein